METVVETEEQKEARREVIRGKISSAKSEESRLEKDIKDTEDLLGKQYDQYDETKKMHSKFLEMVIEARKHVSKIKGIKSDIKMASDLHKKLEYNAFGARGNKQKRVLEEMIDSMAREIRENENKLDDLRKSLRQCRDNIASLESELASI